MLWICSRMEVIRVPEKFFAEQPSGRHLTRSARIRWFDKVYLRQLGIIRWRQQARDREEWKAIVEAEVLQGM